MGWDQMICAGMGSESGWDKVEQENMGPIFTTVFCIQDGKPALSEVSRDEHGITWDGIGMGSDDLR